MPIILPVWATQGGAYLHSAAFYPGSHVGELGQFHVERMSGDSWTQDPWHKLRLNSRML